MTNKKSNRFNEASRRKKQLVGLVHEIKFGFLKENDALASIMLNQPRGGITNQLLVQCVKKGWDHASAELLRRGASPNAINESGHSVLHTAISGGHIKIAQELLTRGAFADGAAKGVLAAEAPLIAAVRDCDEKAVRLLLDHKADINIWRNGTALHCAAKMSSFTQEAEDCAAALRIMRLLIERGADVNAGGKWNQTALGDAAAANNLEAINVLLAAGADIEARELSLGWTALHFATNNGYATVVAQLLRAGADPLQCGNDNKIPLDIARERGFIKCTALLEEPTERARITATLKVRTETTLAVPRLKVGKPSGR